MTYLALRLGGYPSDCCESLSHECNGHRAGNMYMYGTPFIQHYAVKREEYPPDMCMEFSALVWLSRFYAASL